MPPKLSKEQRQRAIEAARQTKQAKKEEKQLKEALREERRALEASERGEPIEQIRLPKGRPTAGKKGRMSQQERITTQLRGEQARKLEEMEKELEKLTERHRQELLTQQERERLARIYGEEALMSKNILQQEEAEQFGELQQEYGRIKELERAYRRQAEREEARRIIEEQKEEARRQRELEKQQEEERYKRSGLVGSLTGFLRGIPGRLLPEYPRGIPHEEEEEEEEIRSLRPSEAFTVSPHPGQLVERYDTQENLLQQMADALLISQNIQKKTQKELEELRKQTTRGFDATNLKKVIQEHPERVEEILKDIDDAFLRGEITEEEYKALQKTIPKHLKGVKIVMRQAPFKYGKYKKPEKKMRSRNEITEFIQLSNKMNREPEYKTYRRV